MERKARELMEDVCDEMARDMAEDKAEVEDLRRESAMVREEVEEERRMLQVSEALREERVQMKLAEAQYELEERATALNDMIGEMEDFLAYRRSEAGDDANREQDIRKAESLCMAVEALQLDQTSFLSVYEDNRPSGAFISTQPDSCSVDSSRDYEQLNEDETFLKQQQSRTKSSKHKGRTKILERSKKNRPRGKILKRRSVNDQRSEWEGANDSESKGNAADVHVFENDYAMFLDKSASVSDSEDGYVNANVHPVSSEVETITEQSASQRTVAIDPQTEKLNTSDIWVSNALATEEHDSYIEESAPNQQGGEFKSPFSKVHTSDPFSSSVSQHVNLSSDTTIEESLPNQQGGEFKSPSSVSQHVNLSSDTTIHEVNWAPMDSRNPHISRGIKGSIEWSKNVRDSYLRTKQEKQFGRRNQKTIR
ncbi:hypothetical protein O6H91_16G060200 [Diphasiastrum complanatum]|nr:hypothetical protein O6H91_16G060200 [Diphasiastrum complanatum]